ncbi:hypothetical protein GCM10029964_030990 [Kibdelosporangium lantanae]
MVGLATVGAADGNEADMAYVDLSDLARQLGGSQPLRGYLAEPPGTGPWPGVVMVHEAFGMDDVMLRQADRLADAGNLTLAVDLFSAGGARRCLVSTFRALFKGRAGRSTTSRPPAGGWWNHRTARAEPASSGSAWAVGSPC